MKNLSLYILLHLFSFLACWSQDTLKTRLESSAFSDSVMVVGKIILEGNHHTEDFVILREMSLRPGAPITHEMVAYDESRIYSLRLFNQVQIHVVPSSPGMANLVIEVSERWYIFPFPVFGIKDRDWNKIFYGFGLLHSNFRGRNEKLYGMLVLGYDPSAAISYRNPFLTEEGNYFLEARLAYNRVRNKSQQAQKGLNNFDEHHVSLSITLGRRYGIEHTLWLNSGYEIVDVSEYQPLRRISPEGPDRFPMFSAGYIYDTRDLQEYPSKGSLLRLSITKYGMPGSDVDIVRYALDVRHYKPLRSDVSWTGRLFANVAAAGITPSYNRVFFGYGERIRGHFTEVKEGENIFGLTSEIHYTLLAPLFFNINFLPAEFSVWKFGIIATAFADAGTVWFRNEPFTLNSFASGYGIGIDLLLPYSAILRVEYAWNEKRMGEFILDIGTSF